MGTVTAFLFLFFYFSVLKFHPVLKILLSIIGILYMCLYSYPEFMRASPFGLVPAIDNNGELVCDSRVIIQYLDEYYTSGPR
jgi:hypothetical protein